MGLRGRLDLTLPGSTIQMMRRVMAFLLVAMFSFSLIGPAVFASTLSAKLLACCRRDGKHHCTTPEASNSGQVLAATRCASFPIAKAAPNTARAGLRDAAETGCVRLV